MVSMLILLLFGFGIGAATCIPPGPISVTLIQVGLNSGRRAGVRAGAGIASADVAVGVGAITAVAIGGAAAPQALAAATIVAIAIVGVLGAAMVTRPHTCGQIAGNINRPARTLFALTAFNPMTAVSWVALLAAAPMATATHHRVAFATGVMLASWCWHPALGLAAGRYGTRIGEGTMRRITRASGLLLVSLATVASAGTLA
jgi:threonine/homoserine/homoserine lactone efflux protein